MNPKFYDQVTEIYQTAVELPLSEQLEFVKSVCAGDEELFREVESLLENNREAEDFLEFSAFEALSKSFASEDLTGKKIGNYRIVREIGRGGMGAVFLGERADGEFEQKVAIKLVKVGLDSQTVIRRFRRERQILASLEHSGIARLLDGGTIDKGVPFLVMEFVEGVPLNEFCRRQNSIIETRLKIFCEICETVDYAHQRNIIHRDLKPSNILVTNEGKPKLLDFGIAKVFGNQQDSSNKTETIAFAMTPGYASPEQINGENLTRATDIYSLGVILFELVTGTRPYQFDSHSPLEIARIICETEPEKPSVVVSSRRSVVSEKQTLTKQESDNYQSINADLDNIILKSLRKKPEERYASAIELAEDLQRYLSGSPVIAKGESGLYKTAKLVRNHSVLFSIVAVLILLISIFAVFYSRYLPLTETEKTQMAELKTKSREALRLYQAGREAFQKYNADGFRQSVTFFEQAIAQDPEFALAYVGLAESYGEASGSYLSPSEALPKQKKALLKALELDNNLPKIHISLAQTLIGFDHDWIGAEQSFRRAVALAPDSASSRRELAWFLTWMGRTDEALEELKIAKRLEPIAEIPVEMDIAMAFYVARNYEEAKKNFNLVLRSNPDFAPASRGIGWCLVMQNKLSEALSEFGKAQKMSDSNTSLAGIGYVQAKLNNKEAANEILAEFQKRSANGYVNSMVFAIVLTGLNDKKGAIEALEKSFAENYGLIWLKSDPFFDSLRGEPEFQKLLKKLGF